MNNTNPELPAEVENEIKAKASFHSGHKPDEDSTPFRNGYYSGYISGATAYATKLLAADNANKALEEKNMGLEEAIKVLDFDNTRMKGVLEGYKEAVDELKEENERLNDLLQSISIRAINGRPTDLGMGTKQAAMLAEIEDLIEKYVANQPSNGQKKEVEDA